MAEDQGPPGMVGLLIVQGCEAGPFSEFIVVY